MVLQIAGEAGGNISLPEARERFHPTLRWRLELPHRVGWDGEADFQKKDRGKRAIHPQSEVWGDRGHEGEHY